VAVLLRLPFLTMVLCGEEGEVGRAVSMVVAGKRPALVIARDLTGKEYAKPPWHNAGGYALPAIVFAPAVRLTGFTTVDERIRAAAALRGAFLALYGAALFVALLLVVPKERRALGGFLLLAFSLFPLPLLGSVQVQYDGSVSTFLVVLSTALLDRGTRAEGVSHRRLALAGWIISLGKLEYMIAGAVTAAVIALVDRRPRGLVAYLAGAAAGTLLLGLWDGEDLVGGYRVMRHFYGLMAPFPPAVRVPGYLRVSMPYLWPLYVALPATAVALLVDRQRRRLLVPVVAAGVIFTGYAGVSWYGDGFPRYFAPCFVLVPLALSQMTARARWIAIAGACLLVPGIWSYNRELEAGDFALCRRVGGVLDWREAARTLEQPWGGCVPRLRNESAIAFYSGTAPFACCGADWGNEWPDLRARLCP
jgi:hypothetical protein